jgi:hypothetical protein
MKHDLRENGMRVDTREVCYWTTRLLGLRPNLSRGIQPQSWDPTSVVGPNLSRGTQPQSWDPTSVVGPNLSRGIQPQSWDPTSVVGSNRKGSCKLSVPKKETSARAVVSCC